MTSKLNYNYFYGKTHAHIFTPKPILTRRFVAVLDIAISTLLENASKQKILLLHQAFYSHCPKQIFVKTLTLVNRESRMICYCKNLYLRYTKSLFIAGKKFSK